MSGLIKKTLTLLVSLLVIVYIAFKVALPYVAGGSKFSPITLNYQLSPYAQRLVKQAYEDIKDPADYHVHLLGIDGTKQTYINPKFTNYLHPLMRARYEIFMHASKVDTLENSLDQYQGRLANLIKYMPNMTFHVFAFDSFHDSQGKEDLTQTDFYISNETVFKFAKQNQNIIEPVISIHPLREDALEALNKWHNEGAKFVKWLPNAMNIDPEDDRIIPFYNALKKYNMSLIIHAGEEHAVSSLQQSYGNPLKFKKALDLGVRVIMAHAATLGMCDDYDSDVESNEQVPCFDLFMRMMDNPLYKDNLYADLSSIYLSNRNMDFVKILLSRSDLHPRFLNASDYPLIAVNIMVQLRQFIKAGLLSESEANAINEIYLYNPLLFDFVLKRTITHPDSRQKFLPIVFEKRTF